MAGNSWIALADASPSIKQCEIPTAYSCSIHKAHASQDTQLTSMRQHEHAILHAYEAWRIWGWTSQEHCQALLVPAREILRASWAQARALRIE